MNIVKPDELHRLVKLAMDTGEAESIEHAQRIFSRYRIGVAVGFEIGRSNTHQAALLTFLRLASRVFLGGVDVLIPDEAAIPNLLPGNQGIAEAIPAAGARRVKLLEPNVPRCTSEPSSRHNLRVSPSEPFSTGGARVSCQCMRMCLSI